MSSQQMSNKLFILSSKMLLSGLGDNGKYSKFDHNHCNKGLFYSINILGLKTIFCHLNKQHLKILFIVVEKN
jgi:hypothetical protein